MCDELLTLTELAERFKVDRDSVINEVCYCGMPVIRVGGHIRFSVRAIVDHRLKDYAIPNWSQAENNAEQLRKGAGD